MTCSSTALRTTTFHLDSATSGGPRRGTRSSSDLNERQRRVLVVSTHSRTGNAARRVGPSGIALIVVAPLTVILVAFTLRHAPSPPVPAVVPVGSRMTIQLPGHPLPTPSASARTGPKLVAFLGDSYAFGHGAS